MNPLLSIVSDLSLRYPSGEEYYSPDEPFPEYRGPVSKIPNPVYRAVREVFIQSGLDRERFATPEWNPLGRFIRRGQSVFVLCNFVYHRKPNESQEAFWSKCTHGSVLRALLDYILIATGVEGKIRFGNAPLQSCNWTRVLEETGATRVREYFLQRGNPVQACDLRCYVAERDRAGRISRLEERDQRGAVTEIDLGRDSLLAAFDEQNPRFRVTDYNPGHTEGYQRPGRHVYALNHNALEADVVFHLPKLKTHEKVGITCALKGVVGAIALKDSLAHHRFGAPSRGGDEYPQDWVVARLASRLHDWVYLQEGMSPWLQAARVLDRTLRRSLVRGGKIMAGAWYGNDTAWRMALDIARLLTYASVSGEIRNEPQRRHLVFVDGVTGGEGNGPLSPDPVNSGSLLFCDDMCVADLACCRLMGFDPAHVPLVREAFHLERYPLTHGAPETAAAILNGARIEVVQIPAASRAFRAPRGWRGHVEVRAAA